MTFLAGKHLGPGNHPEVDFLLNYQITSPLPTVWGLGGCEGEEVNPEFPGAVWNLKPFPGAPGWLNRLGP